MANITLFVAMAAVFIFVTILLGWFGYKHTKNNSEFLLGRNKTSPMIIALSYGATFLSASAIVGFGGQAAKYGMVMIWLVVLNLFIGLIVAFLIYGKRTRRLGKEIKAFTFSDFLGKRYRSPTIRVFSAVIILVGMPVYCAAVLLGGVNFVQATIGVDKNIILIVFSVIVALYVTYGGVIAVMYNDALQAGIMFVGMAAILIFTYFTLGLDANSVLTNSWEDALAGSDILQGLAADGMNGWTSFPDLFSTVGLTVVTTFLLGVGIGALAQPQLVVRFMSAKDDRTLNKSLIIGGIFMLMIVGTAYTVGALSNVFFLQTEGISAFEFESNVDKIIPEFINALFNDVAFGDVFVVIFLLALLSAAISTMSALLHTMGASAGYDLKSEVDRKRGKTETNTESLKANRIGTLVMMLIVIIVAYLMPSNIIAKATSIFMGLTAATLLPSYTHCLYSKHPNLLAAKASIIVGSISWALWAFLVNSGIATIVGIKTIVTDSLWNSVDPLVISLPLSILAMVVVLYIKPEKEKEKEIGPTED